MIRNKVVALLLAVIFACAGFTTTASAKEVNTSLATNPTATLATIDSMNLASLSNEKAGEVRGEGLLDALVLGGYRVLSWMTSSLYSYVSRGGTPGPGAYVISGGRAFVYTVSGWVPFAYVTTPAVLYR